MSEIKVGEYVRTIDGYIRKVIQVNKKGSYEGLCYGAYSVDEKYKNSVGISAKKIVKHSKNIIDLIEEGDYVNGEPVEKVEKNEFDLIEITTTTEYLVDDCYIKSIVTHEQFSQMEYKVEE